MQENIGNKEKTDKAAAKDVRNKALERLGETNIKRENKLMIMMQPRRREQEEVQKVL